MTGLMSETTKQLSQCGLHFAMDIFKEISKTCPTNILVSPISIGVALSMVYGGAKNETKEELKRVLHLEGFADETTVHMAFRDLIQSLMREQKVGLNIHIATRLYLEKGMDVVSDYQKVLQNFYHTDVESVSFSEGTRRAINAWVESKTNKKITDLITEGMLDANVRMVLVNAIYFKGDWKTPFVASRTSPGDFYIDSESKVSVPMMRKKSSCYYAVNDELQCKVLGLPYVNENLLMYVILPNERDGLAALEDGISVTTLQALAESAREKEVNVTMPKFKMEWGKSMEDILAEMGLTTLFSPSEADLDGIVPGCDLYVSSVVHKSFVEVNEQGTEAAAATGVMVANCAFVATPVFLVDHPFLLLIREKRSGTILFMGKVTNPNL